MNPDTSGNGILDGDEVVTYTTETEEIELYPNNKIISNQYDDLVINYSIEGDFLSLFTV